MLLTSLLSVLAPHDCVGCGAEGALLCRSCQDKLLPAITRCYKCLGPNADGQTCLVCIGTSPLARVAVVAAYEAVAKDIIWKLKFGRARAAAAELAALMAAASSAHAATDVIVTNVPTATSRVRQRGYDQAALIAKAYAARTGLPYVPLLRRNGHQKQVGATKAVRNQQINGAYRPIHSRCIKGAGVILIDDVITTGATLETCAAVLRAAGARRVEAVIFAQA